MSKRELCQSCGGNGTVKIAGGSMVCGRCHGECYELQPHGPVDERFMRHYYGASKAAPMKMDPLDEAMIAALHAAAEKLLWYEKRCAWYQNALKEMHERASFADVIASGGLPEAQGSHALIADMKKALDECYTLARRSADRTLTPHVHNKRWLHVIRLCERVGCQPRGVLRIDPKVVGVSASVPAPKTLAETWAEEDEERHGQTDDETR